MRFAGHASHIKLPVSVLWRNAQASAVCVLNPTSMTVKVQNMQIVTAAGNEAAIAAGLQAGVQVVTAGVHVLSPGQKVLICKKILALALINTA